MPIQRFAPGEKHTHAITEYWHLKSDGKVDGKFEVFPDPYVDIIFNLGDAYTCWFGKQKIEITPQAYLSGFLSIPLQLNFSGEVNIFGVRFTPLGFRAYFPHYCGGIFNCILPFAHIPYDGCTTLPTPALIQTFENRLGEVSCLPDKRLTTAISLIEQSKGLMRMETVAYESGLSLRNFERLFKEILGISPKQYANLIRFQAIVITLADIPHAELNQIVYEFDLTDQAHLLKAFKKYAESTPGDMKQQVLRFFTKVYQRKG